MAARTAKAMYLGTADSSVAVVIIEMTAPH